MTRNREAGISAHYNCLFFTPGDDMIQNIHNKPAESLEDFDINAIKSCVSKHEKRKCPFCKKPGAVSECANKKCLKTGWYHFPCGLKNGSVQENVKTFCFKCADKKKTDAKDRGKRKSVSKEPKQETAASKRKKVPKPLPKLNFRRVSEDKVTGEQNWTVTSESDSSLPLSQSSQEDDDLVENTENTLAGAEAVFDNCLNFRLRPIDWVDIQEEGLPLASQLNYSIYIDNAEEDEDSGDSRLEDPDDDPVIPPTEDLSTSIDLKDETPGEPVDSGDSGVGHASQEGKIPRCISFSSSCLI